MKKRMITVLSVTAMVILVCVIGIGTLLFHRLTPSDERMSADAYFGVSGEDETAIMLNDELSEAKAKVIDGEDYLDYDSVTTLLNKRFYWDNGQQQMIYTTPTQIFKIPQDSTSYTVDGETKESDAVIFRMIDGVAFLNMGFVRQYTEMACTRYSVPNRLVIHTNVKDPVAGAKVTEASQVRENADIKSPIIDDIEAGTEVVLLEEADAWEKVATEDGYVGYVQKKGLSSSSATAYKSEYEALQYTSLTRDYKINLAWHQVTAQAANGELKKMIKNCTGLTTISPTWFRIKDAEGNLMSLADKDYVKQAHKAGLEVWALVDNFSDEEIDVDTDVVLENTAARENLIKNLMKEAKDNDLDGINIDFETLSENAAGPFLEFLRELSVSCRKEQIVLSVDNPVPQSYNDHYDRKEQGIVVDYVINMGYDEHYSASEEPGSVASIPFVEAAITETLKQVPREKVINAIPFYTRLWIEGRTGNLQSEVCGMDGADKNVEKYKMAKNWDASVGQNFAEATVDDVTYLIWLEDEESIAKKMELIRKYELGGVAEWKLGFERDSVWKVIEKGLQ